MLRSGWKMVTSVVVRLKTDSDAVETTVKRTTNEIAGLQSADELKGC